MMTASAPISSLDEDFAFEVEPDALAFQPHGSLDALACKTLTATLIQALAQVSGTVIVDLLWVEEITPEAIAQLGGVMASAIELKKGLIFQSANAEIQIALNAELSRQRAIAFPDYTETYLPDFDRFLKQPPHLLPNLDEVMHVEPETLPHCEGNASQPGVQPKPNFPILSAHAYTEAGWRSSLIAS